MFGLSRQTDYAVLALARLALSRRADVDASVDVPISARTLAEVEALPRSVVSGLLKKLQQAGIVRSRRGVEGGYLLATPPQRIRMADIVRAIEGPEAVRLVVCCGKSHDGEGDEECRLLARCPISHAIRRVNHRLEQFLERLTLADLLPETRDPAEHAAAATHPPASRAPRTHAAAAID